MTNKSLAALFFGCILTASAASAQSLLPKPQSFVAGKGAFSTNAKLKVVNEVGAEAENIYSKQFTANTADDARQVVRFTRLDGASSPEAYRLHVTKDTAHQRRFCRRLPLRLADRKPAEAEERRHGLRRR